MDTFADQDRHDRLTINRLDEILTPARIDQVIKVAEITPLIKTRDGKYQRCTVWAETLNRKIYRHFVF